MEKCTEGLCFSSTTTCKDDVSYSEVEKEINNALAHIPWSPETVRPFLWYAPVFDGQGVDFERAVRNLPYKGIKLHPLAHHWDLDNKNLLDVLHKIFGYARENKLPILIHTGHSGIDAAGKFSGFFLKYPETEYILAHCRPLNEAISLIRTYPNVYGDTAFLPEADLQIIIEEGLSHKIMLGSDFPVTNYFRNKYTPENRETLSLGEQYADDFKQLQHYNDLLQI